MQKCVQYERVNECMCMCVYVLSCEGINDFYIKSSLMAF